jgi:AraC-like DNA-binding protein
LPLNEPSVRASVLAVLPEYLRAHNVDIVALLETEGIDRRAIADGNYPIPLNTAISLFERVAHRIADPSFGTSYALAFPIGASGVLGHLMMSAPTVRDALAALSKYLEIHTTKLNPKFEEISGVGWFTFSWPLSITAPNTQYTAFALSTLILRLRLALGRSWQPLITEFQHPPPAPETIPRYVQAFGSRLKFDQARNAIALDPTALGKPMPKLLEGLFESIRELGDQKLEASQAAPDDDAAILHKLLEKKLAAGEPFGLETVAAAMELPVRSLQWRLEQEATSYEKILLVTRVIAAERYLRDSGYNLTKIASLLGFSELSAFTRWCQRQFKTTPSTYRKKLRAQATYESAEI